MLFEYELCEVRMHISFVVSKRVTLDKHGRKDYQNESIKECSQSALIDVSKIAKDKYMKSIEGVC